MKRTILFATVMLLLFASCKDTDRNTTNEQPSSDIDAAREFIRAALDGDYTRAKTFVVNDSLNQQDIEASERLYKERMSAEDKAKYRGASIHIHETRQINDSASIIYYSNTFRNQKDSLKVIKQGGKWLVDFKYIFKHKPDSLQ
ncbi:MAG: DUF4878 domain-containing protein [Chitinophagales bacterium]|nr:DUF4878 domain-containing protein [Chitinophagales bacterium]